MANRFTMDERKVKVDCLKPFGRVWRRSFFDWHHDGQLSGVEFGLIERQESFNTLPCRYPVIQASDLFFEKNPACDRQSVFDRDARDTTHESESLYQTIIVQWTIQIFSLIFNPAFVNIK